MRLLLRIVLLQLACHLVCFVYYTVGRLGMKKVLFMCAEDMEGLWLAVVFSLALLHYYIQILLSHFQNILRTIVRMVFYALD